MKGDNNVNIDGHVKEIVPIIHTDHDHHEDGGGDYINFLTPTHNSRLEVTLSSPRPSPPQPFWYWLKLSLGLLCLGVAGLAVFNWVIPYFIEKVFIPVMKWQRDTFTSAELAIILFASIALFPTILLPSSPSMWLAGMTFGYFLGFLLVLSAASIGVSLPFFIGSMFHRKIEEWLEQYPKKASVLRLAGGGNSFDQFKAVALIRISPFPYMVYNYCAVATNVQYGPYLLGSLVGMMPENWMKSYYLSNLRGGKWLPRNKQTQQKMFDFV
ncbi:TVP38/TMEM64 family membrane protein slr0305-like protein [Trifolium pratense]|uniref:TVP38/TMEM64 family membrane protein slr0305-like protein n=1 Tax=Trifolium pratense TaxID=57577 RepID=A0A2K3MVS3_TRIPR|nr:TVP38/TMEM64 family membrane protein slr0305-like protein [Trifolium pratense]